MKPNEVRFPTNMGWEHEDQQRERRAARRAPRLRTLDADDPAESESYWNSLRESAEPDAMADLVPPRRIPNTVGLDSPVLVRDLDTNEEMAFTIVDCEAADPSANRISFASPVGLALLWRRVGDSVKVTLPDGQARYEIIGVAVESAKLQM